MKFKKIIIDLEKKYYWTSGDLHLKEGVLKAEDIETKNTIQTHLGKVFKVLPANFLDNSEKIIRSAQMPFPKDIASILYYSNLTKDSIVLDSGTGSGFLAINLARFAKKVITYEKNKEVYKVAKKNFENLGLKNIKAVNKDILELTEKNFDIITLDLLEPEKVLPKIKDSLKSGGTLIAYLPNLTQVYDLKKVLKENEFIHIKTLETIEREWDVYDKISKPISNLVHSGFIVVCRKL